MSVLRLSAGPLALWDIQAGFKICSQNVRKLVSTVFLKMQSAALPMPSSLACRRALSEPSARTAIEKLLLELIERKLLVAHLATDKV